MNPFLVACAAQPDELTSGDPSAELAQYREVLSRAGYQVQADPQDRQALER